MVERETGLHGLGRVDFNGGPPLHLGGIFDSAASGEKIGQRRPPSNQPPAITAQIAMALQTVVVCRIIKGAIIRGVHVLWREGIDGPDKNAASILHHADRPVIAR